MTKVIYYVDSRGSVPVKIFMDSIEKRHKAKILSVLQQIDIYGLSSSISHVKRLQGLPLWEIRILGEGSIRVLFAVVVENQVLILHGFRKKSQNTPQREKDIVMRRLNDWTSSSPLDM